MARLHYYRYDNNYSGWGLHLWGDGAASPTTWNMPLYFSNRDDYGVYADVALKDLKSQVTFLLHRGDEKDVPGERQLRFENGVEFWLKQGRREIWKSRPSTAPEFVFAEFLSTKLLRARLSSYVGLNPDMLFLRDHEGNRQRVSKVEMDGTTVVITPVDELNLNKNYELVFGDNSIYVKLSEGLLDQTFFYDGTDLGATVASGKVTFKLWSPPAVRVVARFFDPANQNREIGKREMRRGNAGVWELKLSLNEFSGASLDGAFYQFDVTAYGETRQALDPYARSMAAFDPAGTDKVGKAAIIDLRRSNPADFASDDFRNASIMQNRNDMIAYEVHVRDFTSDPASGVAPELRGTYLGFKEKIPYLRDLGVTHVQLLPLQNFVTVNETDRSYSDARSKNINYNWGYDPQNYFSPEGWYATDATRPYKRVSELKSLVQGLHRAGIGVILDVVYNHTYTVDTFESVCPGCYYRTYDGQNISTATGAGPSVETRRRMVRKLIVESLKYFVDEYHVNGFRFDLMGFIDRTTIEEVRRTLGPDVILHGEAWDLTDLPGGATTKSNLPEGFEVGAFSDTTRDSFAGRMEGRGFVQGNFYANPKVRSGLIGNIRNYKTDYNGNGFVDTSISEDPYDRFAHDPVENLGFLTVHDGFTLWDKINLSWKGTVPDRARLMKLAYGMLFTAQGRVIIHGGDEIGRTKPLAPNDPHPDRAMTSSEVDDEGDLPGIKYFHENSYRSSDFTNMVRWNRLAEGSFSSIRNFVKGAIAIRRSLPLFRLESSTAIGKSLRFLGESESMPEPSDQFAGYQSFVAVPELKLEFFNGPVSETWYLVGEVYPVGTDKNPADSAFPVRFSDKGTASIQLQKSDIERFDLQAWADPGNLQFKLVKKAGEWSALPQAYSSMGNNTVKPKYIRRDHSVQINLREVDCVPGEPRRPENSFIAYQITDTSSGAANFVRSWISTEAASIRDAVVVHNSGVETLHLNVGAITDPNEWFVILDENGSCLPDGCQGSPVKIFRGVVGLPGKSTAVVARRPDAPSLVRPVGR
jgi:pullulanase